MNSRERIISVLEGRIPDRIPLMELWVDPKVFQALYPGSSYYDFIEQSGYYDAVCSFAGVVNPKTNWIDKSKRIFQDKWGARQQFTEEAIPLVIPPVRIQSEEDLISYTPPDPNDYAILNSVREIVKRFKDKKAIIFVGEGVFAPSQYLRGGLENLLIDYKLNPHLAKRIAKITEEYHVELYRRVIREGVEIILLGDDYAGNTGPIMSPVDFERFILPGFRTVVREIKKAGAYCIKHTDGNIRGILDMIVGTGVDALGPLQATAGMDLALIKKQYNICVMGSIDVDLLIRGSAEQIAQATKECIASVSPGGKHILSSANTISSAVPPENLVAMIETARQWGRYPVEIKIPSSEKVEEKN